MLFQEFPNSLCTAANGICLLRQENVHDYHPIFYEASDHISFKSQVNSNLRCWLFLVVKNKNTEINWRKPHLPCMVRSRWISLIKTWCTIIIKANNQCGNTKGTSTIALSVKLLNNKRRFFLSLIKVMSSRLSALLIKETKNQFKFNFVKIKIKRIEREEGTSIQATQSNLDYPDSWGLGWMVWWIDDIRIPQYCTGTSLQWRLMWWNLFKWK